MQFSLSMFNDLLSEFQKYLSARIPRAIYYTLGLVVGMLGTIVVYIAGWNTITGTWNRLDIFFKVVLGVAVGIIFLILAYVLGGLQGTVERWFQGEIRLPFRLSGQTSQVRRHRTIWQGRDAAFQSMTDLYSEIMRALDEVAQWGQNQTLGLTVLQTTHALPRYHVITNEDLETIGVDSVPDGAFQDIANVLGKMVQHPLDAGVPITEADVVGLSSSPHNVMIVAIAIRTEVVPIGLVPGDMVAIYAHTRGTNQVAHLNVSLVVAVEQICREKSNGKKVDLIHLTLAVSSTDLEQFMTLSIEKKLRVVRLIPQSVSTTSTGTAGQHNQSAQGNTSGQTSTMGNITQVPEKIEKLRQDYDAGWQWLKHIQQGILESLDVHPYLDTIDETFTLIDRLRNAPATSPDEQTRLVAWRKEVNDYRNKWIRLLQDAFKAIEYRIDQNQKAFSLYYPSSIEKVAPTSIGNVFRAVDSYCDDLYGLDMALVLPRLQTVMTQSTRDLLTKAHDQMALFEWLYLGSIFTGIVGTTLSFATQHYLLALLLWLLALPIAQFIFYPAAFTAALDYAAALRLAFDRERGKVISMVGFSLTAPLDQEQEKALWQRIQQWWIYGTPPGTYVLTMEGISSEKSS